MNNFTGEFFDTYPNPFLEPGQIAPSPADTSVAQANDYAPLTFYDGGMPAHMVEHQYAPHTGTNAILQQQAAITLPFEAMNKYRQLGASTFASNSGVQQPNVASTSGGSFLPFDSSVNGMPAWNETNGVAQAEMAFNNSLNPQATAEYNSWDHTIQYPQHAMANGFNQLPPNDPSFFYLPNPILQQPAFNATHNQPAQNQQNPGPPFVSYQPHPIAQLLTLNALQQEALGYQQAIGVPAGAYQPEAMAMDQQSFAPYSNDAADALPEQMQRLTTHSPLAEGELASPALNATEDHTLHDASFPAYHSAAVHQPMLNGHHAVDCQQLPEVPPLTSQPQVNMGEQPAVFDHSDATNAPQEQMPRFMTESPLTDEPLTPPDHNAPSNGLVMVPGEVKEHNRKLVSPAMQMPVPLYTQGIFSPMSDSSAAPSPVDPWVNEQAGPANLQGNSQQAAEIPALQPVPAEMPFTFRYAIPPSEGWSSVSFPPASTPRAQKPIRFEFYMGPKSAGAGSSREQQHEHEDAESRPAKRARRTRSPRNSPSPRAVEAHAQGSGELFPLFSSLPVNDAIPGLASAPEQVGASTSYSPNDEMTLYDIFVAMREENDRNRAAGVRNANGDETFTWDESDVRLFDSLRRPSRR